MGSSRQRASDTGHALSAGHSQPRHSRPLQEGFDSLSRELDELAASFCGNTNPKRGASQSQLGSQLRSQQTAFPSAHATVQQQPQHIGSAGTGHAEHASSSGLTHSAQLQNLRDELRSISRHADYAPDSNGATRDAMPNQYDHMLQDGLRPHGSRPSTGWEQEAAFTDNYGKSNVQHNTDWEQEAFTDSFGNSGVQRSRSKQPGRDYEPSPRSVLGCSSQRSLPVLNSSFIVPAQAAKPKKVDRVSRYR